MCPQWWLPLSSWKEGGFPLPAYSLSSRDKKKKKTLKNVINVFQSVFKENVSTSASSHDCLLFFVSAFASLRMLSHRPPEIIQSLGLFFPDRHINYGVGLFVNRHNVESIQMLNMIGFSTSLTQWMEPSGIHLSAVSIGWIKHLTGKWGFERGRCLHWWDEFKRSDQGQTFKLIKRKSIVVIAIRRNWCSWVQVFNGRWTWKQNCSCQDSPDAVPFFYWKVRVKW